MPQVATPALILHAFRYSDTSKILRLLTPDYGLRSVIAKGAMRPKSRFGGVLEPFTDGTALFHLREGRELLTLSDFSLLRSRQGIGRSFVAFAGASLVAEIALRCATEEPHPDLFAAISSILDELAATVHLDATAPLAGVWSIVSLLGFQPELDRCVRCARPLPHDETARFDVEAGGTACRACRPAGRIIPPPVRDDLRGMTAALRPASIRHADAALHRDLLRAFLSTHLAQNRPLRALDLFLDQIR